MNNGCYCPGNFYWGYFPWGLLAGRYFSYEFNGRVVIGRGVIGQRVIGLIPGCRMQLRDRFPGQAYCDFCINVLREILLASFPSTFILISKR